MIAGAETASADTGADTSKAGASASSSDKSDSPGPRRSNSRSGDSSGANKTSKATKTDKVQAAPKPAVGTPATTVSSPDPSETAEPADTTPAKEVTDAQPATSPAVAQVSPSSKASEPRLATAVLSSAASAITATAAEVPAAPAGASLNDLLGSLPDLVQSIVYDFVGVVVTIASGPPVVPPGSKVTVRSSTLELAEGHTVPADWYYPDTDEPPQRIILLQHGFLGVSAMYSWTAAFLAESTNSVVVVPTLSSNRYVEGGFWLGDDQVYRATANLFLGDRDALTASALAAGYGRQYGAGVALPDQFVLVGHSLGGGVVSGAAGYYADAIIASGAENHLAGVILLDAAPPGDTLPNALDKLHGLDTYIPVLELGAPKAAISKVDVALNEDRPGNFNGMVLTDGKHLDAMQGGTLIIQLASHIYQGFPTPQNQAAAQTLIAGWTNDIFAGRIDPSTGKCEGVGCQGIYGDLGETVPLATSAGPTSGVVIGQAAPAPVLEFQPVSATARIDDLRTTRTVDV